MMRKRNLIQQMNRFILLRQMIYLILFLGIISGLVYYILVQYHIIKSQKTIEPIVIISAIFVLALINGFLLLRDGSLYRRFILIRKVESMRLLMLKSSIKTCVHNAMIFSIIFKCSIA